MNTRREFLATTVKAGMGAAVTSRTCSAFDGAAAASIQSTSSPSATKRPNILVLFPDQWRFDWMSANPDLPIRTPNLDRLAKMGTRFTNTVVASPLCAPSRACLAAGKAYGRTGVASNKDDYPISRKTFYSLLKESGYHVLACGKMDLAKGSSWWGLDGKWRVPSWGFSDGINNAGKGDVLVGYKLNNNQPADPYANFLNEKGLLQEHLKDMQKRELGPEGYGVTDPTPLPEYAYCDNWLTQNGLDLLDAAPKDKPWFLQVNWTGPHNPEDITVRMESQVRGVKMPVPNGKDQFSAAVNQAIRQNYTAMCENIDRNIGLYLDKLAHTGQLENTIIIFSSDHGEMLGDHGRWGKLVPYHPSASVPLIAAGPGIARGTTSAALVNHIDLASTYLDYAGIPTPKEMDSRSLRPVLEGRSTAHREVLFSGLGAWRMVFDGEYKAVTGFISRGNNPPDWTLTSRHIQGVAPLIFDRSDDPGENNDLYSAQSAQGQRLLKMLVANTTDSMQE